MNKTITIIALALAANIVPAQKHENKKTDYDCNRYEIDIETGRVVIDGKKELGRMSGEEMIKHTEALNKCQSKIKGLKEYGEREKKERAEKERQRK